MSSYASNYPPAADFDPAYKKFFEDFYALSDTPGKDEEYAQQFTKDATLIMGPKKTKGHDGTYNNMPHSSALEKIIPLAMPA